LQWRRQEDDSIFLPLKADKIKKIKDVSAAASAEVNQQVFLCLAFLFCRYKVIAVANWHFG
jgi:hypothetical protein